MNVPADSLQLRAVVRLDRGVALFLQLAHLRFDRRLVDAGDVVMFLDAERFRERRQQMLFVQLRVALHGVLILDAFRNLAQLFEGLALQVVQRIGGHDPPSYLNTLFGILTWTPTLGLSTSCVTATLPAMLTTWYA